MNKLSKNNVSKQSGFTLIELIIVIVVIGILSAVAVMKMSNVTDAANKAANKAVLGMVKSSWSAAYAVTKVTPTLASIAAQTGDPACTVSGSDLSCGTAQYLSATPSTPGALIISVTDLTLPSTITCKTAADCD